MKTTVALLLALFSCALVASAQVYGQGYPAIGGSAEVTADAIRHRMFIWTDIPGGGAQGGIYPFTQGALAGGTLASTSTPNHPGIMVISSSASANSGYIAWLAQFSGISIGGNEHFEMIFKPSRFAGTTSVFGYMDVTTAAEPVDGVYFVVGTDGVLTGRNRSNSVDTNTAAIYTLSLGVWYRAVVDVDATAASALFKLYAENGSLLASQTAVGNLPVGAGRETGVTFMSYFPAGGVNELMSYDWCFVGYNRDLIR